MQTPSGLLCLSWLFQSFLFLSLIYRCPHFMFLSKLGTCLAILSMQLLSVLIQPQPPATLPSVHGWVSTLSFFLVGHMALGGSFHQRLELWWGCAAGRSALFNTYVHSWKRVDKNCFPVFPKGDACFGTPSSFQEGRLGASVTAPLGSTGAQLCSFLACMPPLPHLPVLCSFCSAPALATEAFLCSQG